MELRALETTTDNRNLAPPCCSYQNIEVPAETSDKSKYGRYDFVVILAFSMSGLRHPADI
jgi:hypothetical protein